MHHEINTIIAHEGKFYKVTESGWLPVVDGCDFCAFYNGKDESCSRDVFIFGECIKSARIDGKNVHFAEVTEDGTPIEKPCFLTFSDDDLIIK